MKGLEVLVRGKQLKQRGMYGFNPYEGVRGFGAKSQSSITIDDGVSIPMKGLEVLVHLRLP